MSKKVVNPNTGQNEELQIITVNIPKSHIRFLHSMEKMGIGASRSELIRMAINNFVVNHLKYYADIDTRSDEINKDPEAFVQKYYMDVKV